MTSEIDRGALQEFYALLANKAGVSLDSSFLLTAFETNHLKSLYTLQEESRFPYILMHMPALYRHSSYQFFDTIFFYGLLFTPNHTGDLLRNALYGIGGINGMAPPSIYDNYFLDQGDSFKNYELVCDQKHKTLIPKSFFSFDTPISLNTPHYVFSNTLFTQKKTYEPIINEKKISCYRSTLGVVEFSNVDVHISLEFFIASRGEVLVSTLSDPYFNDREKIRTLSGRILLIKSPRYHPSIYGHWLLDWLPQILYFHDKGITFDKILIPSLPDFAIDCIRELEPSLLPKLQSFEELAPFEFHCSSLIVASDYEATKHPMNFMDPILLATLMKYVERGLDLKGRTVFDVKKLYLSRSAGRSVINDDEIKNVLDNQGFEVPDLLNLTFLEQVELFKCAKKVVAPHGSALSNIIFCGSDTEILEFFPKVYATNCFAMASVVLGFDYSYIVEDVSAFDGGYMLDGDIFSSSANPITTILEGNYSINVEYVANWLSERH